MNENNNTPKSILEEIFEEMFSKIEEGQFFNERSIKALKDLVNNNNFANERSLSEIIELKEEDN